MHPMSLNVYERLPAWLGALLASSTACLQLCVRLLQLGILH